MSIFERKDGSAKGNPGMHISDEEWFELQFRPEECRAQYGIPLPTMPADEVQIGFTALSGRSNLQQAFGFYQHLLTACRIRTMGHPKVLDFGGGWGRISRLFLRETVPSRIYVADTMQYAIDLLASTGNPCHIIHNEPRPPISGLPGGFDLIYAYSVFSHLSEDYFKAWIGYLLASLRPGGYLAFTSRGRLFIDHLEKLHGDSARENDPLQEHHRRLREEMPSPSEIRRRYEAGDFQFYPIGGAGELTSNFFGEAFISRRYMEDHFGPLLIDFNESVPHVDQSVIVLQKPF